MTIRCFTAKGENRKPLNHEYILWNEMVDRLRFPKKYHGGFINGEFEKEVDGVWYILRVTKHRSCDGRIRIVECEITVYYADQATDPTVTLVDM